MARDSFVRLLIPYGYGALAFAAIVCLALPELALAQAASPFMTGATSLQTNILAWLTPVAVILVMVLGGMSMANRTVRSPSRPTPQSSCAAVYASETSLRAPTDRWSFATSR